MSNFNFTRFGQPILSPDQTEIWAYWGKDNSFEGEKFHFNTLSDLLDSEYHEDTPKGRVKYVYFINDLRYWVASDSCIQRDFADCHHFITPGITGPESVNNAISTLLANPEFSQFFGEYAGEGGESVTQKLQHYQQFNLHRTSKPQSISRLHRKRKDNGLRKRIKGKLIHKLSSDSMPKESLF